MNQERVLEMLMRRVQLVVAAVLPLLLVFVGSKFVGADEGKTTEPKAAATSGEKPAGEKSAGETPAKGKSGDEKPAKTSKKPAKEPRGRLPAHYGPVLTEAQKDKIYELQALHEAKIKALMDQVEQAKKKMNDEIEAVLTPEQLKKVADLKAAADAAADTKRKQKTTPKKEEGKPAETTPTTPKKSSP